MSTLARLASLSLASLLTLGAQAQTPAQTPNSDADKAATTTGTTTPQSEMNRGVPGVNVDVGRNANGAVDVDVDRNTNARNLPGGSNNRTTDGNGNSVRRDSTGAATNGTGTDSPSMRTPRADRN